VGDGAREGRRLLAGNSASQFSVAARGPPPHPSAKKREKENLPTRKASIRYVINPNRIPAPSGSRIRNVAGVGLVVEAA